MIGMNSAPINAAGSAKRLEQTEARQLATELKRLLPEEFQGLQWVILPAHSTS